jgi:hypothetical protein
MSFTSARARLEVALLRGHTGDDHQQPHESAQREERELVAIGRGTPSPATKQISNTGTRPNQRTRRTRSSIVSLLRFARHRTTLSRWVDDDVRDRRP